MTEPASERAALVTGASRNIGRAIAERLARDGADVLVHAANDRTSVEETARLVRDMGRRAEVALGDLTDPAMAETMVNQALERFGRLDVVVANAAVRPEATIEEMSFGEWRQVLALGLDSVFLLVKAALPALKRSPAASIVMIGGLTGHTGAAHRAHVIAAKAGLAGFAKALAHELAPAGITVNTVAPGLIETRRAGAEPAHHAARTNPLGRRGTPDEVAAAVATLTRPDMRYVTGQTLHVNGGALMV
ncbi:SDR family oxidoreductase [Aureimonas jatrophae]|uniref:3-oxoacyl-[acyl-carrier protein] reductase n=1 Tax=Aureimonas jatrophae TaxID=1166073 RepID=A0A1H0FPT4_9HYPH|nr:SDR family oxidoreductase [Aureimonas jatrophae]MBB3949919.1 3-oxoacyl-[acyl-carrier protein] reductase [Aureimonas jatrophae]SDN96542.1 3-oxoacyl-[acyl-carrier protein] reductase [Aureimonas jatrophae]